MSVRATRAGANSTIQRMAALVQSADANKAKIVRLADRWATWVVVGALVAAIAVYLATADHLRAVTVLVVFCPCSLVLATPTAIMAAIDNATSRGFLVKEGDALERLSEVGRIAFDKTGTLTHGTPAVKAVIATKDNGLGEDDLLALAAAAERPSEHPLGKAIVSALRERGLVVTEPEDFEMVPGQGVRATVQGRRVLAGNLTLMQSLHLTPEAWEDLGADALLDRGCTLTYVATDKGAAGIVALSDTLRPEVEGAVCSLETADVATTLLTGDNEAAAKTIAAAAGITDHLAACLPQDKMVFIESCEAQGERAAMIGDGINDAPALRRAYVGIAMGGIGSDIAIDAADIVIANDTIAELPHLVGLSRKTMRKIRANLTFSMALNFLAIVLAFFAVLNPVSGALVHNCGSVFVILNSALLLRWRAATGTRSIGRG